MEPSDYIRFAAALIFVLALIGAGAFALRASGLMPAAGRPRRGSGRRLAVLETLHLDPKRRLALISRDGVEHLVILGSQGETVIESAIVHAAEPQKITEPDVHAELAGFGPLKADRF
jgi:flagellar protein FliO/FliZ